MECSMIKKYLALIICLTISIVSSGCVIKETDNNMDDQKENANFTAEQDQVEHEFVSSNEAEFDISVLEGNLKKLHSIGITDCWVGYDRAGDISVWVESSDKNPYFGMDASSTISKYGAFVTKKVFENTDDVKKVWSMFNFETNSHSLYSVKKENYLQPGGLVDAPSETKKFEADNRIWRNISDEHYLLNSLEMQTGGKFDPKAAIKRTMSQLLGERLVDVQIEDPVIGIIEVDVIIDGLPENKTVKEEAAEIFVAGLGRFSDNLLFDQIYNMSVTYTKGQRDVFSIFISKEDGYEKWLESGLDQRNLLDYASAGSSDPSFKMPLDDGNESLPQSKEIYDPGYKKVMETVSGYKGVKDIILGYDGKNYNALVTIEHESDETDFRTEMGITIEAMKLPFDSIWYVTKDKMGNSTSMTYIDRARFNILMYLKDGKSSNEFDFPSSEWPIVSAAFGEIQN